MSGFSRTRTPRVGLSLHKKIHGGKSRHPAGILRQNAGKSRHCPGFLRHIAGILRQWHYNSLNWRRDSAPELR